MNTKPLHVLMISSDRTLFDMSSPARKRMEEYARAFGKLSVIVFSRRSLGLTPSIGVPLSLYPTGSASRFTYVHDAVRVARRLGGDAIQIVSAQDPFEAGTAGLRIARFLRVPLHVQVHTDFLAPGFTSAHWPLNSVRLWMARRVLKHAAGVRTVSARIKSGIEKQYHLRTPVSVLPIYTDLAKFIDLPHESHPRFSTALLVVSRLEKEKRIREAILALKAVREAGIDAGLDIVGSGTEEKSLRHLVRKLGLADFVVFHGFQNEMQTYYAHADVLLYPGASYEGFGMALVESLAAGVPVVAHDVGIAREAGAVIASAETPAAFAAATVALLKETSAEKPPMPPLSEASGEKASSFSRASAEGNNGFQRKSLLQWRPYASKEDYLAQLKADIEICVKHV